MVLTLRTSDADVIPARHLAMPCSNMEIIPEFRAARVIAPELRRLPINSRISSDISRTSKSPVRPRKPVPLQCSQPGRLIHGFTRSKAENGVVRILKGC